MDWTSVAARLPTNTGQTAKVGDYKEVVNASPCSIAMQQRHPSAPIKRLEFAGARQSPGKELCPIMLSKLATRQ